MIELMDEHVGRLIDELSKLGELENTVAIFMSNNGADARDIASYPFYETWLRENFETEEPTGDSNSFIFAGPGWGQVSTTPHRGAKGSLLEGGIRSPLIIADFRAQSGNQRAITAFITVLDVVPTLLGLVGDSIDISRYDNDGTYRPNGRSLLPVITGLEDAVHGEGESIGFEYNGQAALVQGHWKALRQDFQAGATKWSLYNLEVDPTEQHDFAAEYPEQLRRMISAYAEYENDVGVITKEGEER